MVTGVNMIEDKVRAVIDEVTYKAYNDGTYSEKMRDTATAQIMALIEGEKKRVVGEAVKLYVPSNLSSPPEKG